jgi:hypothetical protein
LPDEFLVKHMARSGRNFNPKCLVQSKKKKKILKQFPKMRPLEFYYMGGEGKEEVGIEILIQEFSYATACSLAD